MKTSPCDHFMTRSQIAPHIIFNISSLPWQRSPIKGQEHESTPWLAVHPFDCNHPDAPELRLGDKQLQDIGTALGSIVTPNDAFSISSTLKEYFMLPSKLDGRDGRSKDTIVHAPDYTSDSDSPSFFNSDMAVEVIVVARKTFRIAVSFLDLMI